MTAILYIILAVVIILVFWLRQLNKNCDFYKDAHKLKRYPIIGSMMEFRNRDILGALLNLTKTHHEGIITAEIGPFHTYILSMDYDYLKCVLSNTNLTKKAQVYRSLQPWLGNGLLTSYGSKWKQDRRILTPAFHFTVLEQFIDIFESCGSVLAEKFKNEVGKNSFDVYPYVTLCALDIIYESILGVNINAQNGENSDYVQSVNDMCRIMMERATSPFQMYDFLFRFTKNYCIQQKALKVLHKQSNGVINARRKQLTENKEKDVNSSSNTKKIFLDILLETEIENRPLTQEEIREQVDTIVLGGYDTIASAVSFTLFCLANHSNIQQKAFEEQQIIFQNKEDLVVSYAHLKSMHYLEQVIKESLRLYPSAPLFTRESNPSAKLGNKNFPKHAELTIFTFGIHRHPKYFPEPEKFKPERFQDSIEYPFAYIPFSAGPRNCLGKKFAMLELKTVISKILRKFELHPAIPKHELQLAAELTLISSNGINIRIEDRNKKLK